MNVLIKSAHLSGEVTVPSSKSEAHRYMICAALSDKVTDVVIHGICSDIEATADCLSALGAGVVRTDFGYRITPVSKTSKDALLKCRDSGSTLRFLIPVSAALGADADFYMEGKLHERPLYPLDAELLRHGVTLAKNGRTLSVRGKLSSNSFHIDGSVSSQFISGILMALPVLGGGIVILEGKVESVDYIKITIDAMKVFGVDVSFEGNVLTVPAKGFTSPGRVTVCGDWSGASFWIAAGALSENGITCKGIDLSSTQGDRRILDVLTAMGAEIEYGYDSVTVKKAYLHATDTDAANIPDAVPVISVLCAIAEGRSHITGAARLRLKESDRLAVMSELLRAMGTSVTELKDGLIIDGAGSLNGAVIDAHDDHRIAMSAAIASMMCNGDVTVTGAECVSKSYSAFWDDFVSLGAVIETCKL